MPLHILPILDQNKARSPADNHYSLLGHVINHRFSFIRKVGAGTYGLIYLVEDLFNGSQYAAKIVLKSPVKGHGSDQKAYIQQTIYHYFESHDLRATTLGFDQVKHDGMSCPYLREIALHLAVHDHPNVVTIHHVLLLEDFALIILMDFFPQGDLFGNIIEEQIFQNPPAHQNKQLLMKNCMHQLITAIAYCADKSVYHCDLKPENIMVSYNPNHRRSPQSDHIIDHGELQVCLTDFGLAMTLPLICCNVCRGSSFYMAPERIVNFNTNRLVKSLINIDEFETDLNAQLESNSKYFPTLAGDIWSLGILFINLTCSRNPWPIANINDRHEVFSNYILNNRGLLRAILPILRQFNALLDDIFVLNPNQRLPLAEMAERIAHCDFYNDLVEFNGQLCTPPKEFKSKASTPTNSKVAVLPYI